MSAVFQHSDRVSQRRTSVNAGRVLLNLFAFAQVLSFSRYFLAGFLGEWITDIAGMMSAASIAVLGMAAFWYIRHHGNPLRRETILWMNLVIALVGANCLRGVLLGLDRKYVFYDSISFMMIVFFIILGAQPVAFRDLRMVWFRVLVVGTVINIAALMTLGEEAAALASGERMTRDVLAYGTKGILDVVVICGVFIFELPRWKRLVVAFSWAVVIVEYVLYQKRLVTTYHLALLVTVVVLYMMERGPLTPRLRKCAREIVVGGVSALTLALAFSSQYLVPQALALMERMTGRSEDVVAESGMVSYLLKENERFRIVSESLETLDPAEVIVGRGMGGGVPLVASDLKAFQTMDRTRLQNSYYLPEYGFFGRRAFEVGMGTLLLKGGVLLFVVYYSIYFFFWRRLHIVTRTFHGKLVVTIVLFNLVYTIFGGDFTLSVIFQTGSGAACLGAVLSRFSSAQPVVRPRQSTLVSTYVHA